MTRSKENRYMTNQEWCIKQHSDSNHKYDDYLPYEFHLRIVAHTAKEFAHLLDDERDYFSRKRNPKHGDIA